MSDNVKQTGVLKILNLDLLSRALTQIKVPDLRCGLILDTSRKSARHWAGNHQECDAAITFDRPLTEEEQDGHYEMALKATTVKNEAGQDVKAYDLWANTTDRDSGMRSRAASVMEIYRIEEIKEQAYALNGLVDVLETPERAGWKRVEITLPG